MRGLLIVAAIILVLALIGWLRFSSPEGDPTIRVDSDKVKKDTSAVVDKAKQAAGQVDESVDVDVDVSEDADTAAE